MRLHISLSYSNCVPALHCFWNIGRYWSNSRQFTYPPSSDAGLCHTDRRTDGQTHGHSMYRAGIASRGKSCLTKSDETVSIAVADLVFY